MSDLTNASFAARASRVAKKSASWASDAMEAVSDAGAPADGIVPRRTAEKYCSDIEEEIAVIKRLASGIESSR